MQQTFVAFQIISQGILKMSKIVLLKEGKAIFKIQTKSSYYPIMHCVVHYINQNGIIISESIDITLLGALPNYVSLFKLNFI